MRHTLQKAVFAALVAAPVLGLFPVLASADTVHVNFENPPYTLGDINGQDGWSKTNPAFDVSVVTNTYGIPSFGGQSLRTSDSVTSGSFGDQTFAKPLTDSVGETGATAGAFSVGTKQTHFEVQFDFASTQTTEQPGMHVSMSPDRGDGSRMSYLRFDDMPDGVHVFFDDVTDPGPLGTVANFNEVDIATLSRTAPHTIKLTLDVVDGPANDVVKVYIDGTLVHTGTSWEDYYRYDPESVAEQSPRIVKTVLFRESGAANAADAGHGFLVDNLSMSSGPAPTNTTVVVRPSNMAGWAFVNDTTDGPGSGMMVVGPSTPPLSVGSAQLTATTTSDGQILEVAGFQGTKFANITTLKYSTYQDPANPSTAQAIALQFNVDKDVTDADNSYQGRIVYEPYNNNGGTVPLGSWNTWDALNSGNGKFWLSHSASQFGGNCSQATPCTLTQIIALYPNIGIHPVFGAMVLKAGSGWSSFKGNADAVTIGVMNNNTTYDFEPDQVSVHIFKFIDGAGASSTSATSSFPMLTTFNSSNIGSATDAPFTLSPSPWGPGDQPYEASFNNSNPGADYATHEVTGGSVVGASCSDGKPFALVGYKTGDTYAQALIASTSLSTPSFTNIQSDKYVLVLNSTCTPPPPVTVVPTTKEQCMNNGWKTLKDNLGHSFKNQGDCVSFVATKGKNHGSQ